MMGEFDRALAKALVLEGGYVNHPKDPGKATNQGITQAVYDDYRRSIGQGSRPVRALTGVERNTIYRMRYWELVKGDDLPPGISYIVFDGAVHSGVAQSVRWLQRALGIPVDGVVGPQTINAVRAHDNHDALVRRVCDLRMQFLKALKTFATFGKGWTARVNSVRAVGQAWAMGDTGPQIKYVPGGEAKALLSDAKSAPSKAPGDAAAGGGAVSALITQATTQLTPLAYVEFVAKAITILTVAGVCVAILGYGYRLWAKRRGDQLAEALA